MPAHTEDDSHLAATAVFKLLDASAISAEDCETLTDRECAAVLEMWLAHQPNEPALLRSVVERLRRGSHGALPPRT